MSYNFTLDNLTEFISSSKKDKYCIDFPNNSGYFVFEKEIITNDIVLFKSYGLVNANLSIKQDTTQQGLSISILLDGNFSSNTFNRTEILKKNQIRIRYLNNFTSTFTLNKHCYYKTLGISLSDDFLKSFDLIDKLQKKNSNNISSNQIYYTDYSKNIHLAKELFNSPFHGGLHDIYMQSKVFDLIYNELNGINQHSYPNSIDEKIKLSSDDIEALYKARDIICLSHIFPDLPTLAKKVAINEFKLKYGFKKLFNSTPGHMILEHKMIHAKKLLETSEFSVGEIANFVGYKYQQAFSKAFMQFFSIRPSDVIKSRKYYY